MTTRGSWTFSAMTFFTGQPSRLKHPEALPYIHVDFALTEDCAAIGISHVHKPKTSVVDFVLLIVPPRHGQIAFAKISKGILMLRGAGVRLVQVSVDSFESVDSFQPVDVIQTLTKTGSTRRYFAWTRRPMRIQAARSDLRAARRARPLPSLH
jgi:hypothetical protein